MRRTNKMIWTLPSLQFDNSVLNILPTHISNYKDNNIIQENVYNACYSKIPILDPIDSPELVVVSSPVLKKIIKCIENKTKEEEKEDENKFIHFFSGNKMIDGADPAAHCYAGHQFGYFSGQLGDGAAMYLGEIINKEIKYKSEFNLDFISSKYNNESCCRIELQLKGSGKTPYSRTADGRKVLRSSLREFLCSEHMWALGIPTTRSGTVITSFNNKVARDKLYTGDIKYEPIGIISRLSPTFLRFGSFEIFKEIDPITGRSAPSHKLSFLEKQNLFIKMMDFIGENYFIDQYISLKKEDHIKGYLYIFQKIVHLTAELVAKWQTIGFCHGVLNTDNMSILGLTLDYGPYGFMENFNKGHICNTSDEQGRYRYEAQPEICKWNCYKLAEQFRYLCPSGESKLETKDDINESNSFLKGSQSFVKLFTDVIDKTFDIVYNKCYYSILVEKFGFVGIEIDEDLKKLINDWFDLLDKTGADFTRSFRILSNVEWIISLENEKNEDEEKIIQKLKKINEPVVDEIINYTETLTKRKERFKSLIDKDQLSLMQNLLEENPNYAMKLGITNNLIEKIKNDMSNTLKLSNIKDENELTNINKLLFEKWIHQYVQLLRIKLKNNNLKNERIKRMNNANPVYILRNHVAQAAIDFAHEKKYDKVEEIFNLLIHPFERRTNPEYHKYEIPLKNDKFLLVSCSS